MSLKQVRATREIPTFGDAYLRFAVFRWVTGKYPDEHLRSALRTEFDLPFLDGTIAHVEPDVTDLSWLVSYDLAKQSLPVEPSGCDLRALIVVRYSDALIVLRRRCDEAVLMQFGDPIRVTNSASEIADIV